MAIGYLGVVTKRLSFCKGKTLVNEVISYLDPICERGQLIIRMKMSVTPPTIWVLSPSSFCLSGEARLYNGSSRDPPDRKWRF
jgi:hypothetical protein